MADNVTLSAAVRTNLLSLQNTSKLINTTQSRLSTGLKVGSPIDDPVAYFQAKSLNDRSSDFTQKKQGIDQGISTLTAATDAINGVESLVQQLKGLILNAKSATTSTEISNIVSQFSEIRNQIGYLTADAQYQGLNLVNGTGSTLKVDFSNDTASVLNVSSVDVTASRTGLSVNNIAAVSGNDVFSYGFASGETISANTVLTLTVGGGSTWSWGVGTHAFTYGGKTLTLSVGSTASGGIYESDGAWTVGQTLTLTVGCTGTVSGGIVAAANVDVSSGVTGKTTVAVNATAGLNSMITSLDSALTTLRSRAQTLGSNVALLQTRLDFTTNYVNTLTAGAGKLNLADLNEEGANLLALQTRQQLGIQALSFAGQAEQGILGLFR